MSLPVGVAVPTTRELTQRAAFAALARAAERLGYAHIWVSDHVLLPRASHVPAGHQLDPLASLAWLAAHTERIGLGTSVLVLPHRGAAGTAKALSTIDWLPGGRLVVGVGAGWLREELAALGVPFEQRGRVTDDTIRTLRELWSDRAELTSWPTGAAERSGAIPILVGGSSPAAMRRAARLGDGWHPLGLLPAQLADAVAAYRELCARYDRPPGRVVPRIFPPQLPPGPERDALLGDDAGAASAQLDAYAGAGADELVISWTEVGAGMDDVLGRWARFAEAIERRPQGLPRT
jgi:probable F420-dependent oxidoreductase